MLNITQALTNKIVEKSGHPEPEIIKYGLITISHFIMGYSVLLVLSWLLDIFVQTFIAVTIFSILRSFSGGAHATSPTRCIIVGSIIFLLIGKLVLFLFNIIPDWMYYVIPVSLSILTIIVIYNFAYATTHQKPLGSYAHGQKLRSIGVVLVFIWLSITMVSYLIVPELIYTKIFIISSCCGVVWHNISLTPVGNKLVLSMDLCVKYLQIKLEILNGSRI